MGKESLNSWYDRRMYLPVSQEFYEGSDFHNLGFWNEDTRDPKQACENLMEKLLGLITDKSGTILDVACGKGATTQYLLKHYPPESVIGINISERQLESCRALAPGCRFVLMSATDLELEDESVHNIICVEAAFHFDTREKFFQEAFRVLRPGGSLVLSDLLMTNQSTRWAKRIPPENWVYSAQEYGAVLQGIGFKPIRIEDITEESLAAFVEYTKTSVERRHKEGKIGRWRARSMSRLMTRMAPLVNAYTYVVVSARKPKEVMGS